DYTKGRLIMTARNHTRNYTTLTDATFQHGRKLGLRLAGRSFSPAQCAGAALHAARSSHSSFLSCAEIGPVGCPFLGRHGAAVARYGSVDDGGRGPTVRDSSSRNAFRHLLSKPPYRVSQRHLGRWRGLSGDRFLYRDLDS